MLHMLFGRRLKSIRSSCSQLAEGSKLALRTKGQRCLEFVIRGGGNMAIICLHSSTSAPHPLQVIHQFDLGGGGDCHPFAPWALETDGCSARVQLLQTLTKEMMFFSSLNLSLAGR